MKKSGQKLRVGVLMGGRSIEHEVSFNSGRTVCDHLDAECYDVIPIFQEKDGTLFILPWHFLHRGKTTDFVSRLKDEATLICWDDLKQLVDFVYLTIHGRYAEDGVVQGFLEILRIPYLGSDVLASALSMNKSIQKTFLVNAGIDVPKDILINPYHVKKIVHDSSILENLFSQSVLDFPCVVKPVHEGSSFGVSIVDSHSELYAAVIHAATIHQGTIQSVLIEEKLDGMEFSCITITDYENNTLKPLSATEVVVDSQVKFFDYEQKYMPGRVTEYTPPRCDKKQSQRIKDTCVKVMQVLGITNISRIDGFLTHDNRIVIQDPNTLSGMGPASFLFREAAEANMSHTDLINHLIETELHSYGMMPKIKKEKRDTMEHEKIRVAVLMGGSTNEKEVSLESGRNVVYKLSPHKYKVIPLFVSSALDLFVINQSLLVRGSTPEIEGMLDRATKIRWSDLPKMVDFVFIGLHGGEGENGSVQGMLEMLNLPYNGSGVLASALCMDKYKTTEFLRINGIDTPRSLLIHKHEWEKNKKQLIDTIINHISFPLIAKPHNDGCSVMVQKINSESHLEQAISTILANKKEHVLIEEFIQGMELTVGVIGNDKAQALPPSQAVVQQEILSMQEKFLPGAGENQTPAPLSKEALAHVQKTIEQTYTIINCKGYARIDCFYQSADQSPTGKDRVVILEINTLPALTPATCLFHQAAEIGMKPMELIDKIVELGLQERKPKVSDINQKKKLESTV